MAANGDATILLPTLNEVDNIGAMLRTLTDLYPGQNIVVVDDDSEDGTAAVVREWQGDARVIVRDRSDRGLSASIYDGISACTTPYFVVMDCDFQHPPEKIAELLQALREGADLAIGVRTDRSALTPFRRFSSSVAHIMAHCYLSFHSQPSSTDIMTGFFAGRTELFQKVIGESEGDLERRGFKALFDLLKFCPPGIVIREVVFDFMPRKAGESKISPLVIISILRQCGRGGKSAAALISRIIKRV